MQPAELFLHTLDDLAEKLEPHARREYRMLRAAGLLRQLLLDDQPLVDTLNRTYRLKLTFRVPRPPQPDPEGRRVLLQTQNLDPDDDDMVEVSRDKFLRQVVCHHFGYDIDVRDVILYYAHVAGGVHAGEPKTDEERRLAVLARLQERTSLFVFPNGYVFLYGIARIVLRALQPLRELVEAGPPAVRRNKPRIA